MRKELFKTETPKTIYILGKLEHDKDQYNLNDGFNYINVELSNGKVESIQSDSKLNIFEHRELPYRLGIYFNEAKLTFFDEENENLDNHEEALIIEDFVGTLYYRSFNVDDTTIEDVDLTDEMNTLYPNIYSYMLEADGEFSKTKVVSMYSYWNFKAVDYSTDVAPIIFDEEDNEPLKEY